jgi:RNA polymerase sigma factor (sigma-70 family)
VAEVQQDDPYLVPFLAFQAAFQDRIFRRCTLALRNQDAAHDVTSLVMIKVWQHRASAPFNNATHLRNYAFLIAKQTCIDWWRKPHWKDETIDDPENPIEITDPSPGPDSISVDIWDCVDRLPDTLQELVYLRFVEGRSQEEVAQALGKEQGNATYAHRLEKEAKQLLRNCLETQVNKGGPNAQAL